ncbi:MAG: peptidase S41 [Acidobacteria bacterium OLB17]|nr:MAG: peptidase S41 [Acidobacteria bacterium OLB17]
MKFLKFTFSFLMAAVVFAAAISVYGQKKKRPRKPTRPAQAVRSITGTISPSDEAALRRDIAMATAWSIVNKTYYDATFGGQDWEKIGTEFALRAQKAKTDDEVDDLIREMVGRLNKSHFGVLSGSFYRSIEAARKTLAAKEGRKVEPSDADAATDGGEGSLDLFNDDSNRKYGVGIDLRKIDGRLVIVSVAAGSSAAEAGVRPGFILDAINGVPLSEITASIAKAAPNVRHLERMLPLVIKSWILDRDYSLNVKVRCLDGNDTPKEFDLERRPLNGEIISFANGFPKQMFEYESRPLSDEIGYIRFNMFSYQLLGKFCDSLAAFKGKKALILDLRGNIGGLLPAMRGLAGMLEPKGTSLGTLSSRGESLDLLTDDKVKKFKGKLVILIDDQSRSASELFSAALQDKGRAVVIGVPTPGEALPSSTVRLRPARSCSSRSQTFFGRPVPRSKASA